MSVVVESGETWLIKHITAAATSGTATEIVVAIETSPTSSRIVARQAVAGNTCEQIGPLFIVAAAGNTIRVTRGAGTLAVTVNGAELEGVAD